MVQSLRLGLALGSATAFAVVTAAASAPNTNLTAVGEIAFAVHHGDGDAPWDIYVVRTDGRWVFKKATKGLEEDDPVWSPDGRHLAFEGFTTPGGADMSIYTRNPDGTHRRRLARGSQPQWSPDGNRIAYADNGIYVMNADGTEKKHLVRGVAADPHWSPDGKRIAFTRNPGGAGSSYTVDAAGVGERRLTRTGGSVVAMWAPGRKIVLLGPDISIINADGTGLRRIRPAAHGIRSIGGWTPDGKLLLYAVATHGVSTWRMSDGSVRRLTRGAGDGDPTWAPGGSEIAFTRNTASTRMNGIWIMNRDGSGTRRVAAVLAAVCSRKMNCRYESMGKWYRWWNEYYTPTWAPRRSR